MNIENETVATKPRVFRASWTVEDMKDLQIVNHGGFLNKTKNYFYKYILRKKSPQDIEKQIANQIGKEIAEEFDKEFHERFLKEFLEEIKK